MTIKDISMNGSCTGCSACYAVCTTHAIRMCADERGFYHAIIESEMCVNCGRCSEVCPQLKTREVSDNNDCYACYAKEKQIQLQSASGGVFFLIAKKVLDQGGIVYGAGFDDTMTVKHYSAQTVEELERLRGSKYVQSDLGNCFTEIKKWLFKDRIVLFSGTPCQVSGLLAFLGGKNRNLLTVDLVCHGTPSNKIWLNYLNERFRGEVVRQVSFRYKNEKDTFCPIRFETEKRIVTEKYQKNIFIRGFIENLYLKEACYQCNYKGMHRESDITIGDCWGIGQVNQKFSNGFGTSFVIVHTNYGEQAFHSVSNSLNMLELNNDSLATIIENNPCILRSVNKPENAIRFWEEYKSKGVTQTVKELTQKPSSWYAKQFVKRAKYEVKYHINLLLKPFISRGKQ